MKKFLVALILLLCILAALAVLAFRVGWLSFEQQSPTPLITPHATAHVIVHATPASLPTRDRSVLRVAIDDRPASVPLRALPDFIKDHGNDVRLEIRSVPEAGLRWQMIAAGHVDLAFGTLDSFVLGRLRHDAGAIVFKLSASRGMDVLVATKGVKDLRGLAGNSVAVVAGAGGSYLLGYSLDRVGVPLSQVGVVETDNPRDAAELLQTGQVQAAWLWEPYVQSVSNDRLHILETTSQEPDVLEEVCVASQNTLAEQSDILLTFVRHWFELESLLRNNPGIGRELVARGSRVQAGMIGSLLSGVRYFELGENQRMSDDDLINQIHRMRDFWKFTGASNSSVELDASRCVKLSLTRQIELGVPTSIFGTASSPSPSATVPAAETSP